jgi:hypothetical protein
MQNKILSLIIILVAFGLVVSLEANDKTQRNYMLVFQVNDYTVQLKEAVTHFFNDVLKPGDQLIVVTPVKLISYSAHKLNSPKKKLIDNILKILKTDISSGASRHRTILEEMKQIALAISKPYTIFSENSTNDYIRLRKDLAALKGSYEERLIKYARIFRRVRGDNHLLMFLQQEFRPIPDKETMTYLQSKGSTEVRKTTYAFTSESLNMDFDLKKIITHFKYASIRFHFLYLKGKKIKSMHLLDYIDNLGEIYSDFSKLSAATNGIKLTSSKPASFVKLIRMVVMYGTVSTEVVDQEME